MDNNANNNEVVLDAVCIDMLKEVGNICTGNATVALSQVLNQRIELKIPDFKLIREDRIYEELKNMQDVLIGVSSQLLGNMSGNIVLLFPEKSAYSLIDSISQYRSELGNATEYGVSSLKEIGNIVISAYLATLSTFTRKIILHSTPNLICGTLETIFSVAFKKFENPKNYVVLVETFFSIKDIITGSFFLIFDLNTVKKLLNEAKVLRQVEGK